MDQHYAGSGIQFRYPSDWTLSEERRAGEETVTVTSPETAFWSVTVLRRSPDPQAVLRAALAAFREEYDELDVYDEPVEWDGRTVPAAEVEFVCLELTNSAFLRAFRIPGGTALVLFQANDGELEDVRPTFDRVSQSLLFEPAFESR